MNTKLPSQDRFEDRLLEAILDDFEHLSTSASPLPVHSRYVRLGAAVALPAAAAATVIAVTGAPLLQHRVPGGATAGQGQGTSSGMPIAAHDAAYVVAHAKAALSGTGRYVLVTTSYAPNSETGAPTISKSWVVTGGNTVRDEELSPTGAPLQGSVITTTPRATTVVSVDYQASTWSTSTSPTASSSGPAPLPQSPAQVAARLRSDLTTGKATLVGQATVGGQATIELEERSSEGLVDLWVDPSSYLPIQEIDTATGVAESSSQAIRSDYQWLPATAGNLALVTAAAAVPSDFTEVPAPAAG